MQFLKMVKNRTEMNKPTIYVCMYITALHAAPKSCQKNEFCFLLLYLLEEVRGTLAPPGGSMAPG